MARPRRSTEPRRRTVVGTRRGPELPGAPPPPLGRDEYARRRRALMREMGRDAIAVIAAAPVHLRNNDVEYAYRQDSDFHHLTGFGEPESVAVLVPGRPQGEYLLFVRDRDPTRETWDGRRAGPAGACRDFGADDAFPIADIDEILPGLMESRARVFYTVGVNRDFDQRLVGWVNGLRAQAKHGRHAPHEIVALEHALHEMRLFKSRGEVEQMRHAARIAAAAHLRAMRHCRPGDGADVAHDLRHLRRQRFRIGQGARTETVQETLAELAERLRALGHRSVVVRQHRREAQLARRQRLARPAIELLHPLLGGAGPPLREDLVEPLPQTERSAGAQRTDEGPVGLGDLGQGAGALQQTGEIAMARRGHAVIMPDAPLRRPRRRPPSHHAGRCPGTDQAYNFRPGTRDLRDPTRCPATTATPSKPNCAASRSRWRS